MNFIMFVSQDKRSRASHVIGCHFDLSDQTANSAKPCIVKINYEDNKIIDFWFKI